MIRQSVKLDVNSSLCTGHNVSNCSTSALIGTAPLMCSSTSMTLQYTNIKNSSPS